MFLFFSFLLLIQFWSVCRFDFVMRMCIWVGSLVLGKKHTFFHHLRNVSSTTVVHCIPTGRSENKKLKNVTHKIKFQSDFIHFSFITWNFRSECDQWAPRLSKFTFFDRVLQIDFVGQTLFSFSFARLPIKIFERNISSTEFEFKLDSCCTCNMLEIDKQIDASQFVNHKYQNSTN